MTPSFADRRRQILETRLAQLYEEYEAVYAQLGRMLSDADALRLKRQANQIEQEIKELEKEILQLERENSGFNKKGSIEESHQVIINLTVIFIERFDLEELRTLCFHLNIDFADLPAEGRANKARELARYVGRHGRVRELTTKGKELRPDIDWDGLLAT